jgi:hypothetical protein
MANSDNPTTVLRSFAQLSARYQQAVVLKAQGQHHEAIASALTAEFGGSCSRNTVNQWFAAGGLLEQAYMEYSAQLADQALKEAKQIARRFSKTAIAIMVELMGPTHEPTVRLNAAKALANKYVPDRQLVFDKSLVDENIPADLIDEGERILQEAT